MRKELKRDLMVTWNEIEELHESLLTLSDEELIECRDSLIKRVEKVSNRLDKHVSETDIVQMLKL
jgi:hypothetical protein